MVHASEGALQIGEGRIYVFFDILTSSYIMMCVERLSYIFQCRLNPFDVSLKMPGASPQGESMFVRIEVQSSIYGIPAPRIQRNNNQIPS